VYGTIVEEMMHSTTKSDFEIGVEKFGYFIMRIIIVVVTCVFFFNMIIGRSTVESLLFSIAIAIALTPEFLPMVMSVTMARGSIKMAKNGVIVKKLAAIPTLGSMTVLCTDKTGTLTEDRITLVRHEDVFGNPSDDAFLFAYLNSHFQTGVENTLDTAIMGHKQIVIDAYRKVDEIPFNFSRKSMSVVVDHANGYRIMITKGAPEEIIQICDSVRNDREIQKITADIKKQAMQFYNKKSRQGFRVVAVAIKNIADHRSTYTPEDENGLMLVGFVSFMDPAKKDVAGTLKHLDDLGVATKIITGDNDLVAQKICRDVGLPVTGIMQGSEITRSLDDMTIRRIQNTTIFARCSPYQKKKIITVLRESGHVVGYMGDGINDAPSIVAADVGISVDNAVDVAKESADIVLTHKSLDVLIDGVTDGRVSFGNTMKYIMMGLSGNFGNMVAIVGAVVFLPFLPMLPLQILLNNFLYDLSHIALSTDHVDREWLSVPRKWDLSFVKKFMIVFGSMSAIFNFMIFFIMYRVLAFTENTFQTGWFVVSIMTQILVIHIIRTRQTPFIASNASTYLYFSTFICALIGVIIPYTFLGELFGFVVLPISFIVMAFGMVIAYLVVVEIAKRIFFTRVAEMRVDVPQEKRYI
jgi:Mg2+-importing ATPase